MYRPLGIRRECISVGRQVLFPFYFTFLLCIESRRRSPPRPSSGPFIRYSIFYFNFIIFEFVFTPAPVSFPLYLLTYSFLDLFPVVRV